MRRQLTTREWMLLALLGVILLISGYMLLFYMPMTAERDRCLGETESRRTEIEAARLRLEGAGTGIAFFRRDSAPEYRGLRQPPACHVRAEFDLGLHPRL